MSTTFPGTTVEISQFSKGSSKTLFDGVFAAGGITLSQVSIMTGLEPYLIQNWVKRGFVTSPVKRLYSRNQFARIIIINMLREVLRIERICSLIYIIGGSPDNDSDDLISDEELYHRYVDMVAAENINISDEASVLAVSKRAADDFEERVPGAKKELAGILRVMLYAHTASRLRDKADEILSAF